MAELPSITYTLVTSPRIAESPSTVDEVTVQDALDTLSAKQDDIDVIGATPAVDNTVLVSGSGKDDLGGGVSVGITSTFDNLQWAFASDYTAAVTGTADATGTTTLQDVGANFVTNGVKRGDVIINYDDKSITEVLTIVDEDNLTHRALNNGTNNDWSIGDNYTIHPIVQKNLTGGNQVATDSAGDPISPVYPTAFTQVVLTASSSATLQNQEELEASTFIGKEGTGVTYDAVNGTDGTAFPYGTRETPCKTEANIETITDNRGFKNVYLASDITITADHSAHPHTWFGDNPQTITITLDNACDVTGNKFQDCYITGKLDAANIIWESIVNGITNANGFIYQSTIVGPITFSADTSIERCWSAPSAASDLVTLDFDNQVIDVQLSSWNGGRLLVKNMPSGAWVHLHGSGHVEFDNTNANGANVTVYPGFHYHDNSGATWGEFHDHTISGETWEKEIEAEGNITAEQAMSIGLAALAGEVSISGNTITFKTPNGNVTRMVSTTDDTGQRTNIALSP